MHPCARTGPPPPSQLGHTKDSFNNQQQQFSFTGAAPTPTHPTPSSVGLRQRWRERTTERGWWWQEEFASPLCLTPVLWIGHRFDCEPDTDPTFHFDAIQIQIRILPQV
jgi:hypothetical protein